MKATRTMAQANITGQLAHHDNLISGLSSRIGHVEKTLEGHGALLHRIENAVTKQDARPTLDVHRSVTTILSLAVLFSMVVGGIIWVTQTQFASVLAEQRGFNQSLTRRVDRHEQQIDSINVWRTSVIKSGK